MLSSSAKKAILSVDYDWRERKVYWVTVDTDSIRWSSLDQKTTGTLIKGGWFLTAALRWRRRDLLSPPCTAVRRCPGRLGGPGLARQEPVLDRWSAQPDCCHQSCQKL